MSAGDSKVLLPRVSARGALRFQRQGVFLSMPWNAPGHRRWASHKHRRMSHCRSVFHWSIMSRNQSRAMGAMGSTWILRRFDALPLGSSSNERGGRGGTRRLDAGELLVCERPVDGFAWSPPGRALQADALRELLVVHDVLLQGAFPELLSAGPAAGRLRVPVWWPTQTRAMAARSARTSSTGCSS